MTMCKTLIAKQRLGAAYVFFGDAHIGKQAFAMALLHYLEHGEFMICKKPLVDGVLVGPNEKNVIGIDDIRRVRKFLFQTPMQSSKRSVVINDAQCVGVEAQSALLKIIEEPPKNALLIFITHDVESLLPPLVSRVSKIYFRRMSKAQIGEILKKTSALKKEEASRIAAESFGRLGWALNACKTKEKREVQNIESMIEKSIINLYRENVKKNAKKIKWLLEKESAVKRLSVNPALQKKAVEEILR